MGKGILLEIHKMDNTADQVKFIRRLTGLSQIAFGKKYNIPRRTLQNWESEEGNPPQYIVDFMARVVDDDLNEKNEQDKPKA